MSDNDRSMCEQMVQESSVALESDDDIIRSFRTIVVEYKLEDFEVMRSILSDVIICCRELHISRNVLLAEEYLPETFNTFDTLPKHIADVS